MFTDLEIFLGHALRGLPVDRRRIRLCALIISGFRIGGIAGAAMYRVLGYDALWIPSGMTIASASTYWLYKNA
jgi:uncharacterized membrane protein YoaK (UPF0700 family)